MKLSIYHIFRDEKFKAQKVRSHCVQVTMGIPTHIHQALGPVPSLMAYRGAGERLWIAIFILTVKFRRSGKGAQ